MLTAGLDLPGVETKQTGLCALKGLRAEFSLIHSDEEILGKMDKMKPQIEAIDAPLSLPSGRASLEQRKGNHLRTCDRALLGKVKVLSRHTWSNVKTQPEARS